VQANYTLDQVAQVVIVNRVGQEARLNCYTVSARLQGTAWRVCILVCASPLAQLATSELMMRPSPARLMCATRLTTSCGPSPLTAQFRLSRSTRPMSVSCCMHVPCFFQLVAWWWSLGALLLARC
jgi:hypothetical protein